MAEDIDSSTSLPKLAAGSSEVPSGTSDMRLSVGQKSEYDEDDDDTNLVVLDPNHVSVVVNAVGKCYVLFSL